MSKDLMNIALEIVRNAKSSEGKNSETSDIEHNIAVSGMVKHKNEKIVAILHDVCENKSVTPNQLAEKGFPKKIVSALEAITPHINESYYDYIDRVRANKLALTVKVADLTYSGDLSRIAHPTGKDFAHSKEYAAMKRDLLLGKKGTLIESPFDSGVNAPTLGSMRNNNTTINQYGNKQM